MFVLHLALGNNFKIEEIKNVDNVENSVDNKKSNEEIAKDVINGKYGNGEARKEKLRNEGYNPDEIQKLVNEILSGKKLNKKSNEEIAKEVIKGIYGNGNERKERLKALGYNADEIQKIVNRILK